MGRWTGAGCSVHRTSVLEGSPSCESPSCESPSCESPSFFELPFLGYPPVRVLEHRGLAHLEQAANCSDIAPTCTTVLLLPPIGDQNGRLEGNLPSFSPHSAALEPLLRLTLPAGFVARQEVNLKKTIRWNSMLRATARKLLELGIRTDPQFLPIRVEFEGMTEPSTVPDARRDARNAKPTVAQTARSKRVFLSLEEGF